MLVEIPSGTLIDNRYQIQRVLGQGGFGRTYLASDTQRFGDPCVLKEFAPTSGSDYIIAKSRELFEREARVLHQIDHPQIPRFRAWLTDKERMFLVQDYINGKTYSRLLLERQEQGQSFSEAEISEWLKDLLSVLDYLHGRNIIHRDISLENIMLPHGQVKPVLIDFGLVKETVTQILLVQSANFQNYAQASVVGKFGYAPPEQIRMGQCYPSSDLYALGVSAIVLLTGKQPHTLMDQSLEWQWRSHVEVSDQLANVLDKMLEEKPKHRFQSAKEVLAELQLKKVRVNIDFAQKGRQLAEIVNSDLFKKLEQRVSQRRSKAQTPSEQLPETEVTSTTSFPEQARASQLITSSPEETKATQAAELVTVAPQHPPETQKATPLNPAFLERCQQELARCIGPMATFILDDVLAQYPKAEPRRLIEVIAAEIPDSQRAKEFRSSIETALEREFEADLKGAASSRQPGTRTPTLNPAFLERCQQELAHYIGPMASFILEDILAHQPQLAPQQLVETLAAEIPNPQRAKEFKQRLL